MEEKLWIVEFINRTVGHHVAHFLSLIGIHVDPHEAIPPHVVMALFASIFLILFFGILVRKPKFHPDSRQAFYELVFKFFDNLVRELIGKEGREFIGMIGSLGLFILVMNYMGLIPGLMAPTSNINGPAGCALFVFLYYNWQGIKRHKFHYIKHFTGDNPFLAVIMFPIEIISHLSRPLSLTLRLFGNITGEEMLLLVLTLLVPFIVPMPIMLLALFTGLLQAFVFVMLSCIYISGAISEHH